MTIDFPEENKELVEQMGSLINESFSELYSTINGRIEIKSNVACSVRDIEITVNTNGIPVNRTFIPLDNTFTQIIGVTVILAINQTNSSIYPTSQPFVSFTRAENGMIIDHISGLQANQRYFVRLIAWN